MASFILVRADASNSIGTGHVMRMLALAAAWRARYGQVSLLTHELSPSLLARSRHVFDRVVSLEAKWPDRRDLDAVLQIAEERAAPTVVSDGYHFDSSYHRELRKKGLRVVAVDDYNHLDYYDVDALVNQNLDAETLTYNVPGGTVMLLGVSYAMLRPEFWDVQEPAAESGAESGTFNLLITQGGADRDNVTDLVLRGVSKSRSYLEGRLTVIAAVGMSNPHGKALRERATELGDRVRLVFAVENMAELMRASDIAISAAGSTCWELARMGLASAVIIQQPNQESVAVALARRGLAVNLGWHHRLQENEIALAIDELVDDPRRRRAMGSRAKSLVDGRGAHRVAERIQALCTR